MGFEELLKWFLKKNSNKYNNKKKTRSSKVSRSRVIWQIISYNKQKYLGFASNLIINWVNCSMVFIKILRKAIAWSNI